MLITYRREKVHNTICSQILGVSLEHLICYNTSKISTLLTPSLYNHEWVQTIHRLGLKLRTTQNEVSEGVMNI